MRMGLASAASNRPQQKVALSPSPSHSPFHRWCPGPEEEERAPRAQGDRAGFWVLRR